MQYVGIICVLTAVYIGIICVLTAVYVGTICVLTAVYIGIIFCVLTVQFDRTQQSVCSDVMHRFLCVVHLSELHRRP